MKFQRQSASNHHRIAPTAGLSPRSLVPRDRILAKLSGHALAVVFALLLNTPVLNAETDFAVGVMSILSKAGCNAGTCHGNLNGKGGFKLSLRGQDAAFDYQSLVFASRGRRVNFLLPQHSLILLKATGSVPHRGGVRFTSDAPEYRELVEWLRDGGPAPSLAAPSVDYLDVQPVDVVVRDPSDSVQIRVVAHMSNGTRRDVTSRACYELSNLKAEVDPGGRVTRSEYGETTLIVRYLQQQSPVRINFTAARDDFRWAMPVEHNPVDRHVFAKLKRLRINPSATCDDTVFVRRAFLDTTGRLPTAAEAREFVQDEHPGKRQQLIDSLLTRPEFADFWALKWADILRTEEKVLDTTGVEMFHGWIRENIARGRPLDQFVRDLVTGVGSTYKHPAANYYRANRDPTTRGETTARLFLGTRLQCAKCHNHPFDRWTQDDYYRWASLFSQLKYELPKNERKDRLDKNEVVGEELVFVAEQEEVVNPTTGAAAMPKLLGGPLLTEEQQDNRLAEVAAWLTAPENELFAESQVNFIWYHLMGRGLVEPIDDLRLTNPASNPELLSFLAKTFVDSGFDLRMVVRTIMRSHVYQLSSAPNPSNQHDDSSYSRAYVRRLPAEVILDMQSDVLDTPAEFAGYGPGIRAIQLPGVQKVRLRDGKPLPGDRFLKTFGKPARILACDCERSNETTLKQAFVLLGDGLSERLAATGNRLERLARSDDPLATVLDELYWTALSRPPTAEEQLAAAKLLDSVDDRAIALEDIAWALLNAKEFLFRR